MWLLFESISATPNVLSTYSYGMIADLGMCLIQRAISYHDLGTRLTYAQVNAFLVDPTVTKVVLIGHSQGGIIVSMAIDDLLAQLPARTMSKLEVYTFGSAASHFSNPSLALLSNPCAIQPGDQTSLRISQAKVDLADSNHGRNIIPHMEHYANEYDLVPRWGVLHSVQDVLKTRYAGSIFVRMGASGMSYPSNALMPVVELCIGVGKRVYFPLFLLLRYGPGVDSMSRTRHADPEIALGHMLNQHYLDPMFPLSNGQKQAAKEGKGIKWKPAGKINGRKGDNVADKSDELFLDRIVTPDEKLAMQRDFTAIAEMGVVRRESGLEFGSGEVLKGAYGLANDQDVNGDECLIFKRTTSGQIVAEEARGKTVKELSRLWKYLGGKSPMDHDYIEDGYYDKPPHERRKNRHGHHNQRKADQELGDGTVLEQQQSPISALFDCQKSPFPRPSPTTDEQVFHVSRSSDPFFRHSQGDLI